MVILLILNIFDALGTHYAVGIKGFAFEVNPIMSWLIEKGWFWFYLIKVGGLSLLSVRGLMAKVEPSTLIKVPLYFCCGLYTLICLNHLVIISMWLIKNL